jgi:hypothetical protein
MNRLHPLTKLTPYAIHRTSPPLRRGLPRKQQLPRTQAMWIIRGFLLIPLALAWFALSPTLRAVIPAPDGDYPNATTAEGEDALFNLTSGNNNTAIGNTALYSNTTGNNNTANGAFALYNNNADYNTATGVLALTSNTTGSNNTATGDSALFLNTTGISNTANGFEALFSNATGLRNTANGDSALFSNTTGSSNTASGDSALLSNTIGVDNTASGDSALGFNTTGNNNTASGVSALVSNTTGSNNIALGESAGINLTTGSNNIDIGNKGVAAESKTIRVGKSGIQTATFIAGITGTTVAGGVGVLIGSNGRLGTINSSARYKENIQPMDNASEAILSLQPVTFRYKKELDPQAIPQFGLVAEQVAKVNPHLVARDEEGKPYSVRYEAVNAMLLNEFLKEHCKVEALEASVAVQQKGFESKIEALTAALTAQAAQIQKVSNQLKAQASAPRLVADNQ